MTDTEAIELARVLFLKNWGENARNDRFTGEVRAVDIGRAIDEEQLRKGRLWPEMTHEQRERASRFFRVVFYSKLPPSDSGSFDAIFRVDKTTGEVTEERYD